jgi:DnaJ-class molecular chaperone
MIKVYFVSGHGDLTNEEFDLYYRPKLDQAIKEGSRVVVGDFRGADMMSQAYLKSRGHTQVIVYHLFESPRNNAGFPTKGGFTSDTQRDREMTSVSDEDIAWVRHWVAPGTRKRVSGTQENLMRRSFQGKNMEEKEEYKECTECSGTGEVLVPLMAGLTPVMIPQSCSACDGKGKIKV